MSASTQRHHPFTFVAELKYYDTVTLRHKDTKIFLHSHPERYPMRYDDGRISSQGTARTFWLPV
jgi:dolichyl-phosphate-mannose--protein O-mannosyl transferase